MIDIATLRIITETADTGSIARAAKNLGISQPQASRMVSRFEKSNQIKLFTRHPSGSALTDEGRLVSQWSAAVIAAADVLETGLKTLSYDDSTLNIGASLTIAEQLIPGWLLVFHNRHPDVSVRLQAVNSQAVIAGVRSGTYDLGFIESPTTPADLPQAVVGGDQLVLIAPPNHPWSQRRTPLPKTQIAATALVAREQGSGTRLAIDQALAEYGQAQPIMEFGSTESIARAVAEGVGPALISELAARNVIKTGEVREIPMAGIPITRIFRAIWPPATPATGPVADLILQIQR